MLAPGKYYAGSVIRLTITFDDSTGTAIDPTTVKIRTYAPNGTIASYTYLTDSEVGKSAVGSYYADITPDQAGRWTYQWETTGTGTTIVEGGNFLIQNTPFLDNIRRSYVLP